MVHHKMPSQICSLTAYSFMLISLFMPYWISINGDYYGPILKLAADGAWKIRQMAELMCAGLMFLGIASANVAFFREDKMCMTILLSISGYYFSLLTIVENASIGIMPVISIIFFLIYMKHVELTKFAEFKQWKRPTIYDDLEKEFANVPEETFKNIDPKEYETADLNDSPDNFDRLDNGDKLTDTENNDPEELNDPYISYMTTDKKAKIKIMEKNASVLMPNYGEDINDSIVLNQERDHIANQLRSGNTVAEEADVFM